MIGILYAVYTPNWQVPDEPAHYNYIQHLAEVGSLPVLHEGDYDQNYLGQLTANGFPPHMSVDSLRYEHHQPPLYYLLATPVYRIMNGSLLALRLFSLVLGAGVVILSGLAVICLFPRSVPLALTTAGFIAFLPQHVSMMAAVNNDSLAELWVALALWIMFRSRIAAPAAQRRTYWVLGFVIGMAFLTKTTVYALAPALVLILVLRVRRTRGKWKHLAELFVPMLLLGMLWWGRNIAVYGWPDLMGLERHAAVVVGQPRTAEWLSEHGVVEVIVRFLRTTFTSFWGQFGWMGVLMDRRVYELLEIFSVIVLSGFGIAFLRRPPITAVQRDGLLVLFALGMVTIVQYLIYNLTFVQHQGRYLFPALLPFALSVSIGLWGWAALIRNVWPRCAVAANWLPVVVVPFLAVLSVVALFWFIVPTLT